MSVAARPVPTTFPRPRGRSLHSGLVRFGALILPIAALMLLSTMFLLARRVNPDDATAIAETDVSERARDRQLTMPRFAGVSREGTAFTLSAREARPDADDPRRMTANDMHLVLGDATLNGADVVARNGRLDTAARTVRLDGDVRIETFTGYALVTQRMEGTLGRLDIVAPNEVRGTGPLGTLRAGALRLDEGPAGAPRMLFTGGVDLLYQPPT